MEQNHFLNSSRKSMPRKIPGADAAYAKAYNATHKKEARAYRLAHVEKHRAYMHRYNRENKKYLDEQARIRRYKRRYGLSMDQLTAMIVAQDNRCAICDLLFTGSPHLDHDHDCCAWHHACDKCRRSLLCGHCNRGLGYFKDSRELLGKAMDYLRKYKK